VKSYRERLIYELELRGLSKSTKQAYLKSMIDLVSFYKKCPSEITMEEIKLYLHSLQKRKGRGRKTNLAANTINRHKVGITFFYQKVFNKDFSKYLPRLKPPKRDPIILSPDEVNQMIDSVYNLQYKAVLMVMYSTGMRQSEIRNLTVKDIDSKRGVINIRDAKGGKDRQAILSPLLLKVLRTHWRLKPFKNTKWIFSPTNNPADPQALDKPLSHTAIAYIIKTAAREAGIKKKLVRTR